MQATMDAQGGPVGEAKEGDSRRRIEKGMRKSACMQAALRLVNAAEEAMYLFYTLVRTPSTWCTTRQLGNDVV